MIYTGSHVDIYTHDPLGVSAAMVKILLDRYFGKNHVLYIENYYISPILSRYLLEKDTGSFLCHCPSKMEILA